MIPKMFIEKIKPGADQCEKAEGIPSAFTIAQAALESAWGSSGLSLRANNLFGVKADSAWTGKVVAINTREFLRGVWVTVPALWRSYDSWADCLIDHAHFFKVNPRYAEALKTTNPEDFARAVAKAGYATDPKYADKLISVMHSHNLT